MLLGRLSSSQEASHTAAKSALPPARPSPGQTQGLPAVTKILPGGAVARGHQRARHMHGSRALPSMPGLSTGFFFSGQAQHGRGWRAPWRYSAAGLLEAQL